MSLDTQKSYSSLTIKFIIFSALFSIPPVLIIILAIAKKIEWVEASTIMSAYGLLAGVYYFFKRLEFDKKSALIKNKRERIDSLKKDIFELDSLFKKLVKASFNNDSDLALHRTDIQSLNSRVSSILEVSQKYGDLSKDQTRVFVKLISFIENSQYFLKDLTDIKAINDQNTLMNYGYVFGNTREIIYVATYDLDTAHLNI